MKEARKTSQIRLWRRIDKLNEKNFELKDHTAII